MTATQPSNDDGIYSTKWTKTFDLKFLIGWFLALIGLTIITYFYQPTLIRETGFFTHSVIKIAVMMLMGLVGGLLCRHFLKVNENGYIIAGSHAWFKVNYTRKIQHFAAYLIPLLAPAGAPLGILPHIWESLFVMLAFLFLIKPLRERLKISMIQFNALDRPEDRPNTLKWIVCGNLLPALILSTTFQQIFEHYLGEPRMALIIVLIIGFGDGFAEPLGIHFGKKKYTVPAWKMNQRYVRSYVGSACVFLATIIIVSLFHAEFNTTQQFIIALIILPPVMTLAEAYAPHSMDTPMMMTLGYGLLTLICLAL